MATITVHGASLAGMAVAARLAKVGHQVTLVAPAEALDHPGPDDLPAVFTFPAPWRDLFIKTGRNLPAELRVDSLELSPVASRTIAGIDLPAERGAQLITLTEALGRSAAESWRDLLDALDDVWQARRRSGLEFIVDREQLRARRRDLWLGHSIEDLARGVGNPTLAELIREATADQGEARRTPAGEACWLAVERTFGLWQVTDFSGTPVGPRGLVDALDRRLTARRVARSETPPAGAEAEILADEPVARRWGRALTWYRRPGPRLGGNRFTCGGNTMAGPTVAGQLLSAALAAYAVHEDLTGADIHPTNKALVNHPRRP